MPIITGYNNHYQPAQSSGYVSSSSSSSGLSRYVSYSSSGSSSTSGLSREYIRTTPLKTYGDFPYTPPPKLKPKYTVEIIEEDQWLS